MAYFTLESPVMQTGDVLPRKYAGNDSKNEACDGDNVSLPLRWHNPPAGTRSFVLAMLDPLGRRGLGVVHWVAYDIPAAKTWLDEGEASRTPSGFAGGRNDVGTLLWSGPCPRFEVPTRPYTIVLIATDLEPGKLAPGLTYQELTTALRGHALEAADFIVRYRGPAEGSA
jgi:Raf kinase inhibitor-like YbhB/YbcL family protein